MANNTDKTMWRGQSATLTIETIQDLSREHIKSYTFDVFNGNTPVNGSFDGSGEGTSNGRAISTTAHVASGNNTGYTDYTVNGYLKYTHTTYGSTTTVATSNTVTKSLRVKEPLDTESLSGFEISPTEVWSNLTQTQNIKINPSFRYTPFSKLANITCSQNSSAIGGGSDGFYGVTQLELNGTSYVEYQNNNANKDLGAASKYIEFLSYSVTGTSSASGAFLYSRSLLVKNAVTKLSISKSLTTYNNAGLWDPRESVIYTPAIPFSKEVSLVPENTDDAYPENTITQNGISVTLDSTTGDFTFNVSHAQDASKTSTFKFRVKSIQGQVPVYSNTMTFTVQGFEPSHSINILEGETSVIENLGIGAFNIPENLQNVTVEKTGNGLGIAITGKAVSVGTEEEFTITSTSGSQVTINCTVINLDDMSCSINTGDTITFTAAEITDAVGRGQINITSISAIETGPASGNGTAYVSKEGNLVYYAPDHAVENVPITVIADNGASVVINIKVVAISMTIA